MKFLTITLTLAALLPLQARADGAPQLINLSLPDVDKVLKTFGAVTNFRPMEPASSWANIFGVSVGIGAYGTRAVDIKQVIPNSTDIPAYLPNAALIVALQGPIGLGVELGVFPTTDVKNLRLRSYAGNLKWTVNEVFFKETLPVDIAVRAGLSSSLVAFKYTISGVTDNAEYTNMTTNFSVAASRKFFIFEPYAGIGFTRQDADLSNEGRINLLGSEFTLRSKTEKEYSSVLAYVGVQTHIWFMNLTLQGDYQYDQYSFAAKLAAKF